LIIVGLTAILYGSNFIQLQVYKILTYLNPENFYRRGKWGYSLSRYKSKTKPSFSLWIPIV